jgi:hypothetical protein
MKLETSGTLRRLDIDVVVELAHALHGEWAGVTFDGQGPGSSIRPCRSCSEAEP